MTIIGSSNSINYVKAWQIQMLRQGFIFVEEGAAIDENHKRGLLLLFSVVVIATIIIIVYGR